jgi:hypothetical protein
VGGEGCRLDQPAEPLRRRCGPCLTAYLKPLLACVWAGAHPANGMEARAIDGAIVTKLFTLHSDVCSAAPSKLGPRRAASSMQPRWGACRAAHLDARPAAARIESWSRHK